MNVKAESRRQKAESPNPALRLLVLLSVLCFLLLFSGCLKRSDTNKQVLAKVGSRELTKGALSTLAGMPADSLSAPDRVRLMDGWIERALVDLEGQHRRMGKDPEILAKLGNVRSELFRAKLLAELPAAPPSDSMVSAYYELHRQEFLRPMDVYSIELYWAQNSDIMARFRTQIMRGDTSMVAAGEITSEGRWLAEAGEMDADIQHEVSSLTAGEVTFPHPYEDGFRVVRLLDLYPAGRVLDLAAVRDEILSRLTIEQSRHREDSLMKVLRERYAVKVLATK
jgi:hypothetical protein